MNIEKWIEQALSKIGTMKIYKLEMFKFAKAKSVLGGEVGVLYSCYMYCVPQSEIH